MQRKEVYVMVVKEEALIKLLCGCGEAFYIEDIFGEEINTKAVEKLYHTFVDMIKVGIYRPSREACNLYRADLEAATYLVVLMTAVSIDFSKQQVSEEYMIGRSLCRFVIKKFPDFAECYEDSEFGKAFLKLYKKEKNDDVKYLILCYLFATLHVIRPIWFDEKIMKSNYGVDWWRLPTSRDIIARRSK